MKKICVYLFVIMHIFCCADVKALSDKGKLLILLNELSETKIDEVASNKPIKNYNNSPKAIIGKIFKKVPSQQRNCKICKTETSNLWYQHNIECQEDVNSKIGEGYYKELIENFIADIEESSSSLDPNAIIEIIPSFLLYFIHNASMYPPLGEGYIQAKEASLPLSYFRDRPSTSPIMDIYANILVSKIIDKIKHLYNFDKESVLLQPLNIRMLEFLRVLTNEDKMINLDEIKSFGIDKENIFLIEKKNSEKNIWQNTFSLITATGVPQNTFTAISSGVRSFFKYYDNDNRFVYNNKSKYPINFNSKISELIKEIHSSSRYNQTPDLYDKTIRYRSEICNKIVALIQHHKFKYIKPFHVKYSQNLMIEVLAPPQTSKEEYRENSIEHEGWIHLINGFFGGLLNHYANQNKQNINTIIRDSYGFLRPTLTPCGTAVRLSMGFQPKCYANIVANALIALDKLLDEFGDVYIANDATKKIVIKANNSCKEGFFIDVSKTNNSKNIHNIICMMQDKKSLNFARFFLNRIKNGYQYNNNYYLNSMIKDFDKGEPIFSVDHIIISIPVAQHLLEEAKHKSGTNSGYCNYMLEAFVRYLNEMILSRIDISNNEITLKKSVFLNSIKAQPVYYLKGFDKPFYSEKETSQDSIIPDVLSNIQRYVESHVKKIGNSQYLIDTFLKHSLYFVLKEIIINYKRIKYLLSQKRDYNTIHFYSKSIETIEKILEDLSILNTICYYSDQSLKKTIKNVIIDDNRGITKAQFLMDWGQQATLSSIIWLNHITDVKKKHLYTDNSSYYQTILSQKILKMELPKEEEQQEKDLIIYYLDIIPTIIFETANESFEKDNTLSKISHILSSAPKKGRIIALILDTSSTPISFQRSVFKKWLLSRNTNVGYLIFVNSGNKNCQMGLDRYQFGQINVYVKNSIVHFPIDFTLLSQISDSSHSVLLNYLKKEMEKLFGQTIY